MPIQRTGGPFWPPRRTTLGIPGGYRTLALDVNLAPGVAVFKYSGQGVLSMPETRPIPPSVDFSQIPDDCEGKWLVIRPDDQAILGRGETARQAIRDSGRSETDESVVLTRVPRSRRVFVVQPKKGT